MELASSFEVYECAMSPSLSLLIFHLHPHHLVSSGLLTPGKDSISNSSVSPFQCPGSRAHSLLCKLRNGQHQRTALQYPDNSEKKFAETKFRRSPKHWTDALLDLRKSSTSNSKHREFFSTYFETMGNQMGPTNHLKAVV